MTANGSVYIKLFDSANQSKGIAEAIVDNIDTQKPENFRTKSRSNNKQYNSKRNSNRQSKRWSKTRNSRNKEYQFILMDSEGTPLTEWIPLEELPAEGEKAEYTFTTAHGYNKEKHIE